MSANHLIVAGVDGSEGGRRALDWAVQEATARGGAVRAIIAWSWDGMEYGPKASCPVVVIPVPVRRQERASEPVLRG